MRPRTLLAIIVVCACAAAPTRAVVHRRQGPTPVFREPGAAYFSVAEPAQPVNGGHNETALKALQRKTRTPFTVLWNPATGMARTLAQGMSRPYGADPVPAARAFLADAAALLGPYANPADLVLDSTRATSFGSQVIFQQMVGGVPVLGYQVGLNLTPAGEVLTTENTTGEVAPVDTSPSVSMLAAAGLARGRIIKGPTLVVETNAPAPRLIWMVTSVPGPFQMVLTTVDAHTGEVLLRQDVMETSTGSGMVYLRNPVATPTLTSQPIPWLTTGGSLAGLYAKVYRGAIDGTGTVTGTQVVTEPTQIYNYTASDPRLTEVQAYYGLDAIHDYFKNSFGFTGRDAQMPAYVRIADFGNAYFDSSLGADGGMVFGMYSGVDFALDNGVLYHEYTHSVVDKSAPAFAAVYRQDQGGMNEGLADYYACSKLNDPLMGQYSLSPFGSMRDLRNRNHYPEDLQLTNYDSVKGVYYQTFPEVHRTGEIWAPVCWDLRQAIGQTKADAVIFKALGMFLATTRMQDALNYIITADSQLNGGANAAAIRRVFNARGIYETAFPINYLNPDSFYSTSTATNASKVFTGTVYFDTSGAFWEDYYFDAQGLFPVLAADRWYCVEGYTRDSTIKSVFVVIKSSTGQLLSYSGNDTYAITTAYDSAGVNKTYQGIQTFYKFPSAKILAGQKSLTGKVYIYSFDKPYATVAANFLTTAAKAIAPTSPTIYPTLIIRVRQGDLNADGAITMRDAIIALRYITGKDTNVTPWEKAQAKMIAPLTGPLTIADVKQMLKVASGLA